MNDEIKSFHYPLEIDRGTGRWAEEPNYSRHVKQLIKQVLFTNPGERINRPDFGCGIRRMIFAPNRDVTASLLQVTVLEALETWLGDWIRVDEVNVESREEVLEIQIIYWLKARGRQEYLNLEVTL